MGRRIDKRQMDLFPASNVRFTDRAIDNMVIDVLVDATLDHDWPASAALASWEIATVVESRLGVPVPHAAVSASLARLSDEGRILRSTSVRHSGSEAMPVSLYYVQHQLPDDGNGGFKGGNKRRARAAKT